MRSTDDIVITGLGVVSPIGIGRDAVWRSLAEGTSGIRAIRRFDVSQTPVTVGGEVVAFDPHEVIKPRKNLKVMSRDIQMTCVAADEAYRSACLTSAALDRERIGIVFGADLIQPQIDEVAAAFRGCAASGHFAFERWGEVAMREIFPLWMLKCLPNMPACHAAIIHDCRGPNNTIASGEVSSVLAMIEAARVIERGQADVMLCGGVGCRVHPTTWVRSCGEDLQRRCDDPARASRPFDADRDGAVNGEGAATFVLERRAHAEQRGARVLARVAGFASAYGRPTSDGASRQDAIERSIRGALAAAGWSPGDVGHVNAHGLSTVDDDRIEAQAIVSALGNVAVTAPKSFFGNLGAGTGAVELLATLLAFDGGLVPITLNYDRPDPRAPVNVIHGAPLAGRSRTAVVLNQTVRGQAVAMALAGE